MGPRHLIHARSPFGNSILDHFVFLYKQSDVDPLSPNDCMFLLQVLSLAVIISAKKLDEITYWTKSPMVTPLNLPKLCRAGRETLHTKVPGVGTVYRLAVSESDELGYCDPLDYETLDALGKGGYGAVTLVKHKKTGQLFAMKHFRSSSSLRYNFLRSEECHHYLATSSTAYGHSWPSPYIAKFYCSMRLEDSVRLLVEYVEGETLMAVLTGGAKAVNGRRRRMKIELRDVDIRRLFAQLVLAIEFIHDRGIVFGDLTTRNIMISTEGNLKLIDFGFSKIIGSGRNEPPSWPNGIRQPAFSENPYIDWYAVGSILYEMAYAQKVVSSPQCPRKPQDVREVVRRENVLQMDCRRVLGDKQLCDLINHFVKQPWEKTWGRSAETRQAIRSHPWFRGFDWNGV